MILTRIQVGPEDHGRHMTLDDFARAEGRPGYLYELAKGEVKVVEILGLPHGLIVQAIQRQLRAYDHAHPGRVYYMAAGSDCALRLPGMQSERHPDTAVYLTPPPEPDHPWSAWIPDLMVEVVSAGEEARVRDYEEKRAEYLAAGVREYWIVDPATRCMTVLRRQGDRWDEVVLREGQTHRTGMLPEFALEVGSLFARA